MRTYYCTNKTRIGVNNTQRREAGYGGASPAVVEGSRSCSHLCRLWLRSIIIVSIAWRTNQEPRETHTAVAKSSIALPAIRASSWLSLISTLIMCTTRLNSLPRESRSRSALMSSWFQGAEILPSQTASKHRSSQVITISATVLLSCHLSGARFMFLLRSSICNSPFAVYLQPTNR